MAVEDQVASLNAIIQAAIHPPRVREHEVSFEDGRFGFYGPICGCSFDTFGEAEVFVRMLTATA